MTLFRDELLTVQDEYLREDVLRIDPEDDDEVGYDNDDLGENSEITPIGDDLDDDVDDAFMPGPDDDDLFDDDDDTLLDDDELLDEDDDEVVDLHKIQAIGGDDDLLDDDDDDLFDDDFDEADSAEVVPDDDDDDLLSDDDDDEFDDDDDDFDEEGSTTAGLNRSIDIDAPDRSTSRIVDHEPGTISPRDI